MKILILSWRDIKHPACGGAEIYTYEISKRLAQKGHKVTWFSAKTPKQKVAEQIEAINFIRRGSFLTVHAWALYLYLTKWRRQFDVVIDQIHGLPFFTPLYVKEKKVAFICEIAGPIWFREWPFPISFVGQIVENLYFRIYRNTPFITISQSTKDDLKKRGGKNINIIHPGANSPPDPISYPKEKELTLISLGRLTPMKRIEHTIQAFSMAMANFPQAKLWIVGRGKKTYENKLRKLTEKLKLSDKVIFWGYISEQRKWELLQKAWALLSTSIKEGWGIVVIEANSVGTPAITYHAPGLKESVRNKETGLLTTQNTPEGLAKTIEYFISNKQLRQRLSENARTWSRNFSWDKAADKFGEILRQKC
ncbi:glycosyltransferase family 4 protein [Patescibacteria group bacterium]|nr:glycosyltransferase family 4 protein [Patescibacteria group bacterium]